MTRPGKVCWFEAVGVHLDKVISPAKIAGPGGRFQVPMVHPYLPLKRTRCNPQQDVLFFCFWGSLLGHPENNDTQCAHCFFDFEIVEIMTFTYYSYSCFSWWFHRHDYLDLMNHLGGSTPVPKKDDMQDIHETCVNKTLDDQNIILNKSKHHIKRKEEQSTFSSYSWTITICAQSRT